MNIISVSWLAIIATSFSCFASDSTPTEAGERRVLRLYELPFDRTDCEKFILSEKGLEGRSKHVAWLQTWDIPFVPSNRIKQYVRKQDTDPDFAVAMAPAKTTKAQLEQVYRVALVAAERMTADVGRYAAPAATPFSELHNAALGIRTPSATLSEELQTRFFHRDGKMILETSDAGVVIGEVELSLETLKIGYVGNPAFWVYEEVTAGAEAEDLEVADFVAQHSVALLRPIGASRPFVWLLAIHNDPETDELENLTLDLYWEREAHESIAVDADVQEPPLVKEHGKSTKLRFLGLGLTTEIDL